MNRAGISIFILAFLAPVVAQAQLLAFPEAEGFGRFATGARTNLSAASVYHVTNLNDSGVGSFRDALSQPNRFVVFDVGGIVNINSVVTVASNITIAGQTAPGGITLFNDRIAFHGANNLISRYFAVRKGNAGVREDAASIVRGTNMIFDHMSITWGVDGTFDINPDSGQVIDNLTIQNSVIAQGLDRLGHSTGGLVQPGDGRRISIIKSLWADNVTRNPKVKGENEFINNVVYGWESAAYIMGGDSDGTSHANVEGNYFIEGPIDGSAPFSGGNANFHIYANDNWVDTDRDGVLDGTLVTSYPGSDVVATRFAFPTTATLSAQQAVTHVMENVGVSIVRDAVDTRLVQEVASYGTLGGVIMRDTDLFPGYGTDPSYLNPRARLVDADNDGIADNWETAHGLSPANGADWKQLGGAGYTRLEEYVNELGAYGTTVTSSGGAWNAPATWASNAPTLADDAIAGGNLTHTSGQAFARRLVLDGSLEVSGGTVDVFDTAAYNGSLAISGGIVTAGRVLMASPGESASLVVQSGGTLQTGTVVSNGGSATLMISGGTFRATGAPDIKVATTLDAAGGTIDTNGYSGAISGAISGVGGLTKRGAGSLAVSGTNAYTGPTVVEAGTLKIGSSAAVQSSASIELESNTVLDVSSIGGGYVTSNQVLSGAGQILGSLQANAGSTVRPRGEFSVTDYAVGVQAEGMNLGSDWALFNNAVHGTGNGGSYNGSDLNGGGIVLASNQNLAQPVGTGLASATVDLPVAGPWYLFVRSVEPSNSGVAGEVVDQVHAGANNSFYTSNNSTTLQATSGNFDSVQTPDNVPNVAKWVAVSTALPPLGGVYGPLDAGISYNLAAGQQTFAIGGRELGTILDGFVLSTTNLTAAQLDAALAGSLLLGNSSGMSISGNFNQKTGSVLEIELSDTASNSLLVGAVADLAGDLAVRLLDGFKPDSSDTFTILTAATLVNDFANATDGSRLRTADGSGSFLVDYDHANHLVQLLDFQAGLAGDFNSDGVVDAADYTVWRNNLGATDETAIMDNGDGENGVDAADYALWKSHFGQSAGPLGSAATTDASVPEPSSLLLAALSLLPVAWRRSH